LIIKNNTPKLLVTLSFLLILPFVQKQWFNLYLFNINDISFYSILYYLSGTICPSLVCLNSLKNYTYYSFNKNKINSKNLGLVTKKFNDFFLVDLKNQENSENSDKFLCKVRKSINFKDQLIYVGDEVIIENIDLKSKRAVITSLRKRKNLLVRPSVANISNIYVTFSVEEPELNLSQVNRFLISAESMGVEVSLVLTKCDLISNKRRSYLIDKFEKWGYQVITLNLQKSDCFKNLLAELKQKECSIFMGPSGVGKTTLLNMIIPGLQNSTSPVSNKIKRGKNTTRNVELFSMSNQSYIVDTPGFNMQPLEVDIKLLPNLYSEIYKQVIEEGIKCKYRNCLHLKDEGCNLNKSFERYSFYKEMIESTKSHYYQNQED